jgi:hypothetical protein
LLTPARLGHRAAVAEASTRHETDDHSITCRPDHGPGPSCAHPQAHDHARHRTTGNRVIFEPALTRTSTADALEDDPTPGNDRDAGHTGGFDRLIPPLGAQVAVTAS